MSDPRALPLIAALVTGAAVHSASATAADSGAFPTATPNIVLILADDLGWGDPQCFNPDSKIPTPAINRLANEGRRFLHAYCPDAICTPTRYALMTGRYSWRTELHDKVQLNWEPPLIEAGRTTLPSLLHDAGYATAGFGKWHLGADFATKDGLPPIGQAAQRDPRDGENIDLSVPLQGGPMDRGFDYWFGFICVSESLIYDGRTPVALIDVYPAPKTGGADKLRPLPLVEFLPEITDRALGYLDGVKAGNKPFFLYFSPYVPHTPLAPPPEFKGATEAGEYGDYIRALDMHIGRILDKLDALGLANDTIVIFASDNGSPNEVTGRGHRPNGGLRGTKGSPFEGGVRTPLIARWPGRIAPGSTSRDLVALSDLLATCAALTGRPLGAGAGEDSFNQLAALLGDGGAAPARESLVFKARYERVGIRRGDWKFVAATHFPWSTPVPGEEEMLFDLGADPKETSNVIDSRADVAAKLREELRAAVGAGATAPHAIAPAR